MIYDIDDPNSPSIEKLVLLDGELVPAAQYIDTERNLVRFAAVDDDYKYYFDFEKDEFVILERIGKIDFIEPSPGNFELYKNSGRFVKPFPYEITDSMRTTL